MGLYSLVGHAGLQRVGRWVREGKEGLLSGRRSREGARRVIPTIGASFIFHIFIDDIIINQGVMYRTLKSIIRPRIMARIRGST